MNKELHGGAAHYYEDIEFDFFHKDYDLRISNPVLQENPIASGNLHAIAHYTKLCVNCSNSENCAFEGADQILMSLGSKAKQTH